MIIDEVHERSLRSDILIGYLKQILDSNKQMKLILMSATIDIKILTNFFKEYLVS